MIFMLSVSAEESFDSGWLLDNEWMYHTRSLSCMLGLGSNVGSNYVEPFTVPLSLTSPRLLPCGSPEEVVPGLQSLGGFDKPPLTMHMFHHPITIPSVVLVWMCITIGRHHNLTPATCGTSRCEA